MPKNMSKNIPNKNTASFSNKDRGRSSEDSAACNFTKEELLQKPVRKHVVRGTVFALCGGIGWGFSGACAQSLFSGYGIGPLWISSVRMLCAGLLLCLFVLVVKRGAFIALWRTPKDLFHLLVVAIAGLAFCQITYLFAIKYSNAGTATVLQYIGPVMIVLFLCFKGGRAPSVKEIAAMILVVGGTFLLATHGDPTAMVLSPEGLFWGLIAAVAFALYTLLPGRLMLKYGSIPVVASALLVGGVVFSLGLQSWANIPPIDAKGMTILFVGLVFFGTVVGFTFYFQAVHDIGAAKTSLLASVETVSATLFAVLWLGTSFTWVDIVGFVCIMATVFILSKPSDTMKKKETTKGKI